MHVFRVLWVSARSLAKVCGSKGLKTHATQKENDMKAHFRKGEFLKLEFHESELLAGYNVLLALQAKTPSRDLEQLIKAMESYLFPPPKLILISNFHICEKCFCELDVRKDAYHVRTNPSGVMSWTHQICPPLKENRP